MRRSQHLSHPFGDVRNPLVTDTDYRTSLAYMKLATVDGDVASFDLSAEDAAFINGLDAKLTFGETAVVLGQRYEATVDKTGQTGAGWLYQYRIRFSGHQRDVRSERPHAAFNAGGIACAPAAGVIEAALDDPENSPYAPPVVRLQAETDDFVYVEAPVAKNHISEVMVNMPMQDDMGGSSWYVHYDQMQQVSLLNDLATTAS